jgi:hypothetical protein
MFDTPEDSENYCRNVINELTYINNIRIIVESSQNIITIFDSEMDEKTLSTELFNVLNGDNVKMYFLFLRDNLITTHIPYDITKFLFNKVEKNIMLIDYNKNGVTEFNLDDILEKIEVSGIDSLTPNEKKFLDNFEK